MKELDFPFDSRLILKKRRSLKKQLLADEMVRTKIKIAVLGGSTTDDIVSMAELFLLNLGIEPLFYQSEYAQFWEDGVFGNDELEAFSPDIVYICTSFVNLQFRSDPSLTQEQSDEIYKHQCERFKTLWSSLERFGCPIIQNNFEPPFYALLGSMDSWDYRGAGYLVNRMNLFFAEYAIEHDTFYLLDLNRTAAELGLARWHDRSYWYMYKVMCAREAVPTLSYKLSLIIKSIYGKNRKLLALDLDNTLWGGVVGDDGVDGLSIGQETAEAQAFYEFQMYVKDLKKFGVALSVCSKNEEENALAGLNHPEGVLCPDDFAVIKSNWEPKDVNLIQTVSALDLTTEALVFVDDNPAERERVTQSVPQAAVVKLTLPEFYVNEVSDAGYFEPVAISDDDLKRSEMYRKNAKRAELAAVAADYGEYLDSLEMIAKIEPFVPIYYQRITQLTNKSNQFNLTTRRYTQTQIEQFAKSSEYITLYGKLEDKFGDNGVVSVVIGQIVGDRLKIALWLMSCRVLKRDMELAMLDELVKAARAREIAILEGEYIPSAKNGMVSRLYPDTLGFSPTDKENVWTLDISEYTNKNTHIKINEG